MTQYAVQIGPVGLRDLEVPSTIDFGGSQRLVVHKLHGGAEIIERLGPEPKAIQFSGIFTGQDAAARYRTLDAIRLSGHVVWLTWGPFRHRVIIQRLDVRYDNLWWIRFSIVCSVVPSLGNATSGNGTTQQIFADLASITDLALGLSLDTTSLSAALSAPQALQPATVDQNAARAAACDLQGEVEDTINDSSDLISSDVPVPATAADLSRTITSVTSAGGSLASATTARGYLMRINNALGGNNR